MAEEDLAQFIIRHREYLHAQDELKQRAKELAPLRKRTKELKEMIMAYMREHHAKVALPDGKFLVVVEDMKAPPLKLDFITAQLTEFFSGDEQRAQEATDFINEAREEKLVVSLKITKPENDKKKKKTHA